MSVLAEHRQNLAEALGQLDLTTYTHVPGVMDLPAAFVAAGTPYIAFTDGNTFGERTIRFEVCIASQIADNLAETETTDDLIESAIIALGDAEFDIEEVGQPFIQTFNQADALCVILTVSINETRI